SLTSGILLLLVGAAFRRLADRASEAEQRRREMDGWTNRAMAETGQGLWDWNLARGHVRWSPGVSELLGCSQPEAPLPFREVNAAIHPGDDIYAAVEPLIGTGGGKVDTRFRMRKADGGWIALRLRGSVARDRRTGEPHLLGIASAEEAATAATSANAAVDGRLRDAVENISEAFVLWDQDNRLVLCNRKYQQFYKLPDHAVTPGAPYEAVVAAATEPLVTSRTTLGNNSGAEAYNYEAQLADGRWLHIDERRTRDGGYVSVGTDITALKTTQQRQMQSEKKLKATIVDLQHSRRELEQQKQQLVDLAEKYSREKNRAEAANRTKSEFLANISHELRTPLNAVIGFSEVMENALFGPIGNVKYQEYARDIHQSGQYLLEVIDDILDMSKIEAGHMSLDMEPVELGEIIEDSLRIISGTADERGITLVRSGTQKMKIEADRRAVKQILLNLLSNAVKFTPDGGEITVKLGKAKEGARLSIADTGIGIPSEELGKLGRPFAQLENPLTKRYKGSGLGLAISRSLAEMHGGRFEIRSAEGEGTTVVCVLPLKATPAETTGANGQA
ncbi:MAG: ATP-binding protein, partial [Hyphomicrobiales bacterium]